MHTRAVLHTVVVVVIALAAADVAFAACPIADSPGQYSLENGATAMDGEGCPVITPGTVAGTKANVYIQLQVACHNGEMEPITLSNLRFAAKTLFVNLTTMASCITETGGGVALVLSHIAQEGNVVIEYSGNHTILITDSVFGYEETFLYNESSTDQIRFKPVGEDAFLHRFALLHSTLSMICSGECFGVQLPAYGAFALVEVRNSSFAWLATTRSTAAAAGANANSNSFSGMIAARHFVPQSDAHFKRPITLFIIDCTYRMGSNDTTLLSRYQGFTNLLLEAGNSEISPFHSVTVDVRNATLLASLGKLAWPVDAGSAPPIVPALALVVMRDVVSVRLTIQSSRVDCRNLNVLAYSGLLDARVGVSAMLNASRASSLSLSPFQLSFYVELDANIVAFVTQPSLSTFSFSTPDDTSLAHGLCHIAFPPSDVLGPLVTSIYDTVSITASFNGVRHMRRDALDAPGDVADLSIVLPPAQVSVTVRVVHNSFLLSTFDDASMCDKAVPPTTMKTRSVRIITASARDIDVQTCELMIAIEDNVFRLRTVSVPAAAIFVGGHTPASAKGAPYAAPVPSVTTLMMRLNNITAFVVQDAACVNVSLATSWSSAGYALIGWTGNGVHNSSRVALPTNLTVFVSSNAIVWAVSEVLTGEAVAAVALPSIEATMRGASCIIASDNNISITLAVGSRGAVGIALPGNVNFIGKRSFGLKISLLGMSRALQSPFPAVNSERSLSQSIVGIRGNDIHIEDFGTASGEAVVRRSSLRGVLVTHVGVHMEQAPSVSDTAVVDVLENKVRFAFHTTANATGSSAMVGGLVVNSISDADCRIHGNTIAVLEGAINTFSGVLVKEVIFSMQWDFVTPLIGVWFNRIAAGEASRPVMHFEDVSFYGIQVWSVNSSGIVRPIDINIDSNTVEADMQPAGTFVSRDLDNALYIPATCRITSARIGSWGNPSVAIVVIASSAASPTFSPSGGGYQHVVYREDVDRDRFMPFGRGAYGSYVTPQPQPPNSPLNVFGFDSNNDFVADAKPTVTAVTWCPNYNTPESATFAAGIMLGSTSPTDPPSLNRTSSVIANNDIALRILTVVRTVPDSTGLYIVLNAPAKLHGVLFNFGGAEGDAIHTHMTSNRITVHGVYASAMGVAMQRASSTVRVVDMVNMNVTVVSGTRLLAAQSGVLSYTLASITYTAAIGIHINPTNISLNMVGCSVAVTGCYGGHTLGLQQDIRGTPKLSIVDSSVTSECWGSNCAGVNFAIVTTTTPSTAVGISTLQVLNSVVSISPTTPVGATGAIGVRVEGGGIVNVWNSRISLNITLSSVDDGRFGLSQATGISVAGSDLQFAVLGPETAVNVSIVSRVTVKADENLWKLIPNNANTIVCGVRVQSITTTTVPSPSSWIISRSQILIDSAKGFDYSSVSAVLVEDALAPATNISINDIHIQIDGHEDDGIITNPDEPNKFVSRVRGIHLRNLRLANFTTLVELRNATVVIRSVVSPSVYGVALANVSTASTGTAMVAMGNIIFQSSFISVHNSSSGSAALYIDKSAARSLKLHHVATRCSVVYESNRTQFALGIILSECLFKDVDVQFADGLVTSALSRGSEASSALFIFKSNILGTLVLSNSTFKSNAEHAAVVDVVRGSVNSTEIRGCDLSANAGSVVFDESPGLDPFSLTGVAGLVLWDVGAVRLVEVSDSNVSVSCLQTRFCNGVMLFGDGASAAPVVPNQTVLVVNSHIKSTTRLTSPPQAFNDDSVNPSMGGPNFTSHGAVVVANISDAGGVLHQSINVLGSTIASHRGSGVEVIKNDANVSIHVGSTERGRTTAFVQRSAVHVVRSRSVDAVVVVAARFQPSENTAFALGSTAMRLVSVEKSTTVSNITVVGAHIVFPPGWMIDRTFAWCAIDNSSSVVSGNSSAPALRVAASSAEYPPCGALPPHTVVLLSVVAGATPNVFGVELSALALSQPGSDPFPIDGLIRNEEARGAVAAPIIWPTLSCNSFQGVVLEIGIGVGAGLSSGFGGNNTDCEVVSSTPLPTPTPAPTIAAPPNTTDAYCILSSLSAVFTTATAFTMMPLNTSLPEVAEEGTGGSTVDVDGDVFDAAGRQVLVRLFVRFAANTSQTAVALVTAYMDNTSVWKASLPDSFTIENVSSQTRGGALTAVDISLAAPSSEALLAVDRVLELLIDIPQECSTNASSQSTRSMCRVAVGKKTQMTPAPVVTEEVADGVSTTTGVVLAVTSTLGAGSVTSGPTATRFKALLALSTCEFSHTEALDFLTSPTAMSFGPPEGQFYRGGVVGSLLVLIACGVATIGAGVLLVCYRDHQVSSTRPVGVGVIGPGLLLVHFPSVLFVPFGVLVEGLTVTSTATVVHAQDSLDVCIGVLGYAAVLGMLAYGWITIRQFACVLKTRSLGDNKQQPRDSLSLSRITRMFHAEEQWVVKHEEGQRRPQYKQQHLHLFNDYRVPHYPILETTVTVGFGVFEGLRLSEDAACYSSVMAVLLMSGFLLVYSVWKRPALIVAEAVAMYALNVVALLASALLVIGTFTGDDDFLSASDMLSLIGMLLTAAKVLSSLAALLLWLWASDHCSLASFMARRFERLEVQGSSNPTDSCNIIMKEEMADADVVLQLPQSQDAGEQLSPSSVPAHHPSRDSNTTSPAPEQQQQQRVAHGKAFHQGELFEEIEAGLRSGVEAPLGGPRTAHMRNACNEKTHTSPPSSPDVSVRLASSLSFADFTFERLKKRQEESDRLVSGDDGMERPLSRIRITQTTTTIELEDL